MLAGILYPWGGAAKHAAPVRWLLHIAFWTSLLAGLWYVNRAIGLERALRSPWPILHQTWLPLVGLVLYVLGWLGRGMWLALRHDPPICVWPDLEAAWSDMHASLAQANVPLDATPLFLVLGPLTADLRALLKALGASSLTLRANAPLQVFTHPGGVFVVCDKLSHVGLHALAAGASNWSDSYPDETAPRLDCLCRRLAMARAGTRAVQGIVLVVPFGALQTDDETRSLIRAARSDLGAVRRATGLEAPVLVAISGADLPVGRAWLQHFPPVADLDPAEAPAMLQAGVENLCLETIAGDLRRELRLDTERTDEGKPSPALRRNIRLFQSLAALPTWSERLGQVLVEATVNDYSEPGMVTGCHFLSDQEAQAAGEGILSNLVVHQQSAIWTAESIAAAVGRRRRAWAGYGLGVLGTCAGLACIGWFLWPRL